ncbi:cytochrome b [Candidatus Pandoraea novymonadis]|uniref:Cytochrome b n=1 Tax=Candidatus Pandoraea novymonadis TaxID=1808959 RepID=A0ABX5FCN9_9BURK|nr:cytochrome bc complex cytochrome b subunit [Candidatus Pandoraea novymonadis]PSB91593.1 cytochrome b [Candidatus Pandoraea novymonadis]
MVVEKHVETTGLLGWIDRRFPLTRLWRKHASEYYVPKNFNFWYFFGSLGMLLLVIQILTGIFLTMNYKPDSKLAFASVEYIMREVPWGWLIRYMHSTGASMFFVVVYLHIFRGLLYGSYRKPRELVWIFGCFIFLCLMVEAFMGYLLPWGQMSYWGAQVIVNLFSVIPVIGTDLSLWIRGDYIISDATLNRFFALHIIAIPLILIALVVGHIIALHEVGSNNPDGIEIKEKKNADGIPIDGVPFHPYYTTHVILGIGVFLMIFSAIVFFAPTMAGYFLDVNNFMPSNSLITPQHITPVWYFSIFYSILRATTDDFKYVLMAILALTIATWSIKWRVQVTTKIVRSGAGMLFLLAIFLMEAKFFGMLMMFGAVISLFFMPWLDKSPVKSIRYRPVFHKVLLSIFVFFFLLLGYLGMKDPTPLNTRLSQVGTLYYFCFFGLMPVWSQLGTFKPVPDRVTYRGS